MEHYVSSSDRGKAAQEFAARLTADGMILHPAVAHGKKIARSFWGFAWCRAIERFQDYESRLPAGRSLLRAGAVIDLAVNPGEVFASVADGELFTVRIPVTSPEEERMDLLRSKCAGKIASLLDLIQGNLSEDILEILGDPENGLFPEYGEIRFLCNCIDDSCLCSHAAAALYGIGARLDDDPALLFRLRNLNPESFFDISAAADSLAPDDGFNDAELSETFGIDIGTSL